MTPSILDFLAQSLVNGYAPQPAGDAGTLGPAQPTPTPDPQSAIEPEITVTANRPQPVQQSAPIAYPDAPPAPALGNGPTPPDLGNRQYAEMAKAAVANDRGKQKSHLHQILDNIGDALLMAYRMDPIHKQHADEQDASNALAGFTQNPLAAMERLNAVGGKYTKDATDLYNDYQTNQYKQAELKSLDAARQSLIGHRQVGDIRSNREILQKMLAAASTPEQRQQIAATYGPLLARQADVSPEDLGILPGMTDEDLINFASGQMTVNQQKNLPIRQQTANAATVNAAAHMKNANRHSSGAVHMTDQENYYRINQPGYKKTPADMAWEKKYLHGTRTNFFDTTDVPPPPGAGERTKGWTVKRN